jgi:hypothetical protein
MFIAYPMAVPAPCTVASRLSIIAASHLERGTVAASKHTLAKCREFRP